MRNRWWAAAAPVLAGVAAVITACGSSAPSSSGAGSGASTTPQANTSAPATTASGTVSTRHTSIGTVLVNSQGRTLYWFAIDTPTKSNCTGSCLTYWPPVTGTVKAAPGTTLPKGFGTITSDGKTQATYDGHPLYTYVADTSAGMTSGNGKNLSGGLWWAMTPSGHKLMSAPSGSSSSSTGGGGGYGY
jgi:predicted lipoprotein with Yx(FWY)xxD motif